MLEESDDLVILGATFDSKMTFEKHLRLLRNIFWEIASWEMLSGFCPARLRYCFAVWCSAADTHLKLLDRVVSSANFLTGGVFECDLAHRQSVAVLWMLYKIRRTRCTLFMVLFLSYM